MRSSFFVNGSEAHHESAVAVETPSLAHIEQMLARLLSQQEPVHFETTPAALGVKTLIALDKLHTVTDFTGEAATDEAVLDSEQQAALARCSTDTEVVKFLTPVLWRLRMSSSNCDDPCRPVLVNSENCAWLDNLAAPLRPNMRLKPDLFVAPHVCIEEQTGTPSQGFGSCFLFGRLANSRLQRDGCVREVYEAKLADLTTAHFGELIMYHRLIPDECRGMLFNRSQFWLFATYGGYPLRLVRSEWIAPGSATIVRGFFENNAPPPPQLMLVLRHLLSALDLRQAPVDGTAFLGAGGSGRVFAVRRAESPERLALKVVAAGTRTLWMHDLTTEYNALTVAAQRGAPVVPVVAGSLCLAGHDGGGFLLAHCGVPFDATASLAACTAAFAALAALHDCAIVHGDARLPNLLLIDGKAVWIDMAAGLLEGPASRFLKPYCSGDAELLAQSVLLSVGIPALPASVATAVACYDFAAPETVQALAAAVWVAVVGSRVT